MRVRIAEEGCALLQSNDRIWSAFRKGYCLTVTQKQGRTRI